MKTKMMLKANDDLWNEVLKYKIDKSLKNNNEAILELIKKGLKK